VVVRDRRRIDPETGELRPPEEAEAAPAEGAAEVAEILDETGQPIADPAADTAAGSGSEPDSLRTQLDERTADLQRISAEYANYRKRVDRDREAATQAAKAGLVGDLLPLLDDFERADQHGDLTGAFKSVADKLVATLEKAGLQSFGSEGEPFDPNVHEAVQHATSSDVEGPTVTTVLRRGYRFGDRVVRAAMVAVTDYEGPAGESAGPAAETGFTEPPPSDGQS
jgi:molecular chaperone GrpE